MPHIFISYSKKNRDYAHQLADQLLERGFDVWIDDRIDYGENWYDVIVEAVRACGAFTVIMTPESKESRWVQREVAIADDLRKPLFPILLDGENFPIFVLTQYVDAREKQPLPEDYFKRLSAHVVPHPEAGKQVRTEELPPVALQQRRSRRRMWTAAGCLAFLVPVALIAVFILSNLSAIRLTFGEGTEVGLSVGEASRRATLPQSDTATADPALMPTATLDESISSQEFNGEIAFLSDREEDFLYDLYLMDSDGENVRRLTEGLGRIDNPVWSPDGSHIAFVGNRDFSSILYALNLENDELRTLTEDDGAVIALPIWGADSNSVLYYRSTETEMGFYIYDSDIGTVAVSDEAAAEFDNSQVPEDAWYNVFVEYAGENSENADIFIDKGDGRVQLTFDDALDIAPSLAPDGSTIAFASNRAGNFDIYLMDTAGENLHPLTNDPADDTNPVWRPR